MRTYIAIDNGVSGWITILDVGGVKDHFPVKTNEVRKWTKKKGNMRLIDSAWIYNFLDTMPADRIVIAERPMVNPTRWNASISAVAAYSTLMGALIETKTPYQWVDSKDWQKEMIGKGVDTKFGAMDVCKRLFPNLETKEPDSVLMAEWARRKNI